MIVVMLTIARPAILIPFASATVSVCLVAIAINDALSRLPGGVVWRPYAFVVILSLAITLAMQVLLARRSSTGQPVLFWFHFLCFTLEIQQVLLLARILSVSPEAAAFWQGLTPLAWVLLPIIFSGFVISSTSDGPVAFGPIGLAATMIASFGFGYVALGTDFIERHAATASSLQFWGWESRPGQYAWLVFAWLAVVSLVALYALALAYRDAADERRRQQLRLYILAFGQFITLGLVFDVLTSQIGISWVPPFSPIYTGALALILGYGMMRHGLLQMNPAALADSIVEHLGEGVWGINRDRNIEFANPAAAALTGLRVEDVRGQPLAKLLRPSDMTRVMTSLRRGRQHFSLEGAEILRADGKAVPVTLRGQRVTDHLGQPSGYILVAQDITALELKSQELAREKESVESKVVARTDELHHEQARLKASIEGLSDAFMLIDEHQQITIQNRALRRLFGLRRTPASVAELDSLLDGYDLAGQIERVRNEARPIESGEVTYGSKVLEIFAGPVNALESGNIKIIGTVVVVRDVTEAKVLARSRDEFFSIASHELRTPLTAIKGNSSMLLDMYAKDLNADIKEMIGDIHTSSDHLIEIVNDFLDLSRLEQGKMKFSPQTIEPAKIVTEVLKDTQGLLHSSAVKIEVNKVGLSSLPPVYADPSRIRQVLDNLVGNAIKFTEKGLITITVTQEPGAVRFTVTDEGRGMSVESQRMLFHKFQQASDSLFTRDSTRGTGLGLYISKLIVEQSGGTIRLDHSAPGAGSAFSFTVPLAEIVAPQAR